MKRLLLAASLLISINALAQTNSTSGRFTTKLGFAISNPEAFRGKQTNFRAEINYGFARVFEVGAYAGHGFYILLQIEQGETGGAVVESGYSALNYGVNANFHILPLLIKEKAPRFDLYLSGKVGGIKSLGEYSFPVPDKFHSDYGIYGGAAYFIGKHFGLYGEFGYGNYTRARYGLVIKF